MSLGLAGCGLTNDPRDVLPSAYTDPIAVQASASQSVGRDEALAAADLAIKFALAHGLDPVLLDPQRTTFSAEELTGPAKEILTDSAYAAYGDSVGKALAGDDAAQDEAAALMAFGLREPEWRTPSTGPVRRSQTITKATVQLASDRPQAFSTPGDVPDPEETPTPSTVVKEPLVVSFKHQAVLRYLSGGAPVEVTVTRDVDQLMERTTAGWRVSQFTGPFEVSAEKARR